MSLLKLLPTDLENIIINYKEEMEVVLNEIKEAKRTLKQLEKILNSESVKKLLKEKDENNRNYIYLTGIIIQYEHLKKVLDAKIKITI